MIVMCVNATGNPIYQSVNVNGEIVYSDPIEHTFIHCGSFNDAGFGGIPNEFQNGLYGAIQAINESGSECFGIAFINDSHDVDNGVQRFIEKYADDSKFSRFVWGGDTANDNSTIEHAVDIISQQTKLHRLVVMGNHEHNGNTVNPVPYYRSLIDASDTNNLMDDKLLAYYSDDEDRKVRYIIVDSTSGTGSFSKFNISDAQSEWIKSVMPSDKDVIMCDHAMINPFTHLGDQTNSNYRRLVSSSHNTDALQGKVVPVIKDWHNKGGRFIGYLTGHYHTPGYSYKDGFPMFTGASEYSYYLGTQLYLIDKANRTITMLVCHKTESGYYAIPSRW